MMFNEKKHGDKHGHVTVNLARHDSKCNSNNELHIGKKFIRWQK